MSVPVIAELSLGLVDEAIYQLSEDLSGPIYSAFYTRMRPLGVLTSDSYGSLAYYSGEETEEEEATRV